MSENATNPSTEADNTEEEMIPKGVMLARLRKESQKRTAMEEQMASLQERAEMATSLQERLAELEAAAEDAGKSAIEKAQAQASREVEKLRRELDNRTKQIAEKESAIAEAHSMIQRERAERAVTNALSTHKVNDQTAATKLAMIEIELHHGPDGVTASYGDVIDGTVSEAIAAWTKDRPMFLPAPSGGAGTRAGSGPGGKSLDDLSPRELMLMARRK